MNLAGKPHWRVLPSVVRTAQLQLSLNISSTMEDLFKARRLPSVFCHAPLHSRVNSYGLLLLMVISSKDTNVYFGIVVEDD